MEHDRITAEGVEAALLASIQQQAADSRTDRTSLPILRLLSRK
jgi:hypothetical protein